MRGRGALGKTLVAVAVELNEPRGFGLARMGIIDNARATTLRTFLTATVEPGSTVVTDGLASYPTACRDRFTHDVCDQLFVGRLSRSFRPFQRLVSCQKSSKNPATENVLRDGFRIGPGAGGASAVNVVITQVVLG